MALFVIKRFPAILVRTSEEMVTAIPPGLSVALPRLTRVLHVVDCWEELIIPPHSLLMPMHAVGKRIHTDKELSRLIISL